MLEVNYSCTHCLLFICRGGSTSTSAAPALGACVAQELKPAAIANPFMFGGSGAPVMPVGPTVPVVGESEQSKKIRKLNESFFKWASKQIETHPLSIWKDGVQVYPYITLFS